MSLADAVLGGLLQRGERAKLRDSTRAIQISFTSIDSPYWQQSLDQRQHFHLRMSAAERAGAVQLQWSTQGHEDRPLEKVRLRDVSALAEFLGETAHADAVRQARDMLASWLHAYPRMVEIADAWAALKAPRGLGIASAPDFADALRVLDALAQHSNEDQIIRVLSRKVFRNSKRIEALSRHIDLLTSEHLASPARQQEEVFNALGLVKEPQPLLTAGGGALLLRPAQICAIANPFIGVSNHHVIGYEGAPRWVLSVENLTTFHQASQDPDAASGLIIYTGGMPSPSWCRAYALILECIPDEVSVYHWGDVDQGGFRIAAHIRRLCVTRHAFYPWQMDARQLPAAMLAEVTEATRNSMSRHAIAAGWISLGNDMLPMTIEQEGVDVTLPLS